MEQNRRFTILTFPQSFDGSRIKLNILFLPRNQNPLKSAVEGHAEIPQAPPFSEAKLRFRAKIISDLSSFPINTSATREVSLTTDTTDTGLTAALFQSLATQFEITNLGTTNTNTNVNNAGDKAPDAIKKEDVSRSVRKYLPRSYRNSFNFVSPRTKNAVTDDSYFCAIRDAKPDPGFKASDNKISWGKAFAFILRQPDLAKELGFIYQAEIAVNPDDFKNGGWLFVELDAQSDYFAQQEASVRLIDNSSDPDFIKTQGMFIRSYAARIPALEQGTSRVLFAPLNFPVLYKKPNATVDPVPEGNFDQIFIEAAEYDDGFCKILHSFQPHSQNFMKEDSDGFHPQKESGIRLGWDDEQILIWYMRQMMEDETAGSQRRIDAPLGIIGYNIDVREKGLTDWVSLNRVKNKIPMKIGDTTINDTARELSYQVYPSQLDGDRAKAYWLPMYFANWTGKSMVLPDVDAISIYQLDHDVDPDSGTNVTGTPENGLNKVYDAVGITTSLFYNKTYEFRARMSDLTGGGPTPSDKPQSDGENPVATCHFKRFVAPAAVRIQDMPVNQDGAVFEDDTIKIQRPLLGYPSVVFTNKYSDPIALLKSASEEMIGKTAFGLSDPDVVTLEITVELQTLKMDNLLSISGKESYIEFYTTTRKFPEDFDGTLEIPIAYRDCNVLRFGDSADLGDLGITQSQIDQMDALPLPTSRHIRLTIRAVCREEDGYYGLENPDKNYNTRYGTISNLFLYRACINEKNFFAQTSEAQRLRGIYLQPDPPGVFSAVELAGQIIGAQRPDAIPNIVQRLAQALQIDSKGMTLIGKKGDRIQFGCSNHIRHTLSPDHSSVTFADKGDLMNHWLSCVVLQINRDWTWDGLEGRSFVIHRKKMFGKQVSGGETGDFVEVGDIELKRTVSFNALQNPDRDDTTIIFIDAVEPQKIGDFPDIISLEYSVETRFKTGRATQKDDPVNVKMVLPVTNNPGQVPKIVSAGIALSPYIRNEKYSETGVRTRFLWIEFEEPISDPNDQLFARVLNYAPDQLISNNELQLFFSEPPPPLTIDPEYIRIITPGQSDDNSGLDAMQVMEKALDSDVHYLLPLPPGLHSESDEMFGFFTYEFRIGHAGIWSTAQGRFGRPLKATGLQHPAPVLKCNVNRDNEKLYVSAPYAVAVFNGKNVTANPPRTELYALLYAQVMQADGKDYRNILLGGKNLDWRLAIRHRKGKPDITKTDPLVNASTTLKYLKLKYLPADQTQADEDTYIELRDEKDLNKDAARYGTGVWSNKEVNNLLAQNGLPADSSLSVLCVEMLPRIKSIYDHVDVVRDKAAPSATDLNARMFAFMPDAKTIKTNKEQLLQNRLANPGPDPLSDELGHHRILRTSPLVEVPFICCTDC